MQTSARLLTGSILLALGIPATFAAAAAPAPLLVAGATCDAFNDGTGLCAYADELVAYANADCGELGLGEFCEYRPNTDCMALLQDAETCAGVYQTQREAAQAQAEWLAFVRGLIPGAGYADEIVAYACGQAQVCG